jgi:hypothetical protein
VHNQPGGVAVTVRLERELRIDSFVEEAPLGHWECAQTVLTGALNIQPPVPSRQFKNGIGTGLIETHKARKPDRVNGCLPANQCLAKR